MPKPKTSLKPAATWLKFDSTVPDNRKDLESLAGCRA